MPRPSKRTRSEKRILKSLPGGSQKIQYKRGNNNAPRFCHLCNRPLAGVRQASASGMSKLNRSRKRVWRPYGGQICHNCLKIHLKQAARSIQPIKS